MLKLKDKKEKGPSEATNSKDIWKDIKITNADLSNLLAELDKAIGKANSISENLEDQTEKSQGSINNKVEFSQASPGS